MSRDEVHFIGKMMLDEIMELFATVSPPEEAKSTLKGFIDDSKDISKVVYEKGDVVSIVADQADALVDSYYYSLNAAAKKGLTSATCSNSCTAPIWRSVTLRRVNSLSVPMARLSSLRAGMRQTLGLKLCGRCHMVRGRPDQMDIRATQRR